MLETELGALREQSLTHVKERVALKAILDDKVRGLISDIGQSVAELPIEVRPWPLSVDPQNLLRIGMSCSAVEEGWGGRKVMVLDLPQLLLVP